MLQYGESFLTSSILLVLAIVLGPSAVVIVPMLRRFFLKPAIGEITPQWLQEYSPDRYRSMANLLANDDFSFLLRQPGFELKLYRKLRRERLAIFRQYLDRLVLDFRRLHLTARMLTAQNRQDSTEIAQKLFKLQLHFNLALIRTEFEYSLCRYGLATVHVQRLIEPLRSLSEALPGYASPSYSLATQ
jgi:hypothetical protein